MKEEANDKGCAKVFIIKTEYGYSVSPSPVVVPKRGATLDFENLSPDVVAKVSIPGAEPFTLEPNEEPKSVTLPDNTDKTKRVMFYKVEMKGGLFARGNSAPSIIRDP